nr:N-acyl-phosphatidylethanolamine-hydrolyzing phospholipase D [Tanacetum cinerariifolium]
MLLEVDGRRFLTDPVWAERASPSQLVGPKRFFAPPLALADVPPLDGIILSHDHYDHLDPLAIRMLAGRTTRFYCPLGVGAHLRRWGVPADKITELTWWDEIGEKFGPFDLVMLEIGAADAEWAGIHLGPDEATRAHQLLGGGPLLPLHWGTFNLAFHAWRQPVQRLLELVDEQILRLPAPGQRVEVGRVVARSFWQLAAAKAN